MFAANDGARTDIGCHMSTHPVLFELQAEFQMACMASATQHDGATKGAREAADPTGEAPGGALHREGDASDIDLFFLPLHSGEQSLDPIKAGISANRTRDQKQTESLQDVGIIAQMVTRSALHGIVDAKGLPVPQEEEPVLTKYQRAINLMEAPVADELLALDREGTRCFGFNESATVIWRQLETPKSMEELVLHVSRLYAVEQSEAVRDVEDLMHDLMKKGLVVEVEGASDVEA